ncbi:MAG: hypothetical protein DMG94_00905, partial [Acidobacteria bacterium]
MAGFKDHEGPNREKSPTPPSSPLKQSLNAVKTPPPKPDSGQNFDSEAPTILHSGSAFDAATIIEPSQPSHASEAATMLDAPVRAPSRPAPTPPASNWNASFLLPTGSVLANRYEILDLLGEGGMGAVYKARDNELDRLIALKVIRPELSSNPEILQRFKQELVLARQVTDRNIIRIFDLGEANGMRFITMEYVEGTSLYQILREHGKLGVVESAEIITQVLSGLKAAHREGVIHRDLKPGNIMRDPQGRILVMDFGLARSLESDGMTKTGAVLGTMEYMSPEQAMGAALDQRSDLFTVGLIFFELLTGKMPFRADSALASLLKRVHERAIPVVSHDATIPAALSNIVSKCLERDVQLRYQNAGEMLDDLAAWQGGTAAATLKFPESSRPWGESIPWPKIGVGLTVAVLATVGFLMRGKLTNAPAPANKSVSVLVADFTNSTGDPIFEDTLEPMFNVALEGANFINAYSRGTARNLAK